MLNLDIVTRFLISFTIGISCYKIFIPFLNKKILSIPNARSSHLIPTPNGGGIIFVSLFILVSLVFKTFWPLCLLPLAIIGFVDDIKSQSQKVRFSVQLFTSISLLLIIFNNLVLTEFSSLLLIFIIIFLTFLSISIINFVNFMDGIDGLVASNILCLLIFKSYFGDMSLIYLIGFLSAFLCFNWYPAKIFMGDVGSTFLGGTLVYILISAKSLELFFAYLIAASPLIVDPTIVILRRIINSENIFKAHKRHLYQRLVHNNILHWKVSLLYFCYTSILCLSYIIGNIHIQITTFFVLLISAYFIDKRFAVFFEII